MRGSEAQIRSHPPARFGGSLGATSGHMRARRTGRRAQMMLITLRSFGPSSPSPPAAAEEEPAEAPLPPEAPLLPEAAPLVA